MKPVVAAVLLDYNLPYGRGLLRGVHAFAVARGWQLVLVNNQGFVPENAQLTSPAPDALIASAAADRLEAVWALGVPTISVSSFSAPRFPLPRVISDHAQTARLLVEEFASRGYRQVGYFQSAAPALHAAWRVGDGLRRECEGRAIGFHRFLSGARTASKWTLTGQLLDLADWLRGVPKPIGVACSDDEHGWRVLRAAADAGLRVPQDVAVIGNNNDEMFCVCCTPALSSLALDQHRIGLRAAEMAGRLLDGQAVPTLTEVPPIGVITRASSDHHAVPDPDVVAALELMRRGAANGMRIDEVLREVPVSASTLHRRFMKYLGHAPGEELRRIRRSALLTALRNSSVPMGQLARQFGYRHASELSREVRRWTGMSPTDYRRAGSR
jgi:LacI family transcriptional regulator